MIMKRTSANRHKASSGVKSGRQLHLNPRGILISGVIVGLAVLMFFVGRYSGSGQQELFESVHALQLQIWLQQREVDRLRTDNQQSVNALSARLAELQAASTRLDALGERLAQMGQLSLDEFDFAEPAPVGGPADYETMGPAEELELRTSIAALGDKLRRQSSQLDALQFLMMNRQLESDLTPSGWPVGKGWISSRYGERNDPFTGERTMHWGLDFTGTQGTDVLSVASGVVIWAANRADYGKTVEIDHGNGFLTRYAHNRDLAVRAGDHVTAGQVIAQMGSTGRASGPHVHFEVLQEGQRINPSRFVEHLR